MNADDQAALRGRLLVFCYQMLRSPFEAEDAVQDSLERAWRSRETYNAERGVLSTWVFHITRNMCFDLLRDSARLPPPRDLGDPGIDIGVPLFPALDVPWLMPAPSSWCEASESEERVVAADGVRLAVTAVLQALPPRQRGVFILRDVLGYSAAETAAILGLSGAAANSARQRARAAVRGRISRPLPLQPQSVANYAHAIEQADVRLGRAGHRRCRVRDSTGASMAGRPETYAAFMAHLFAWRGTRWTSTPVSANDQPGILLYLATDDGLRPQTSRSSSQTARARASDTSTRTRSCLSSSRRISPRPDEFSIPAPYNLMKQTDVGRAPRGWSHRRDIRE
jgi:RNA polymerase sigma-70 factor (ECF subfamily)